MSSDSSVIDQVVQQELLAVLGLGPRLAHDRIRHRQHLHRLGIATSLPDALLLVAVVRAGDVDVGVAGEDDLGPPRREVPPPPRRAGLQQHRATLGAARHRERAADLEPLALVVELVDRLGLGEQAVLAVEHQRVVIPGVPEPDGGLEELVRPVVARVVSQDLVDAEVLRLAVVDRGDDVPCRPTPGEVVERRERPRHMERRVVGGRVGGAESDVAGRAGQDAEHDAEVELHRAGARAHGLGDGAAVDAGHRQPVVEEHQIEAPVLEGATDLLVVARCEEPVLGGRVPPRPRVHRRVPGLHEAHQRHLPPTGPTHGDPFPRQFDVPLVLAMALR
jgi:hypothetical protein